MPVKNTCKADGCKRKSDRGNLCYACEKRLWREKYPMRACFQTLKDNAIRRGKEFALTFEQFEKFCYETNYMAGKGRTRVSYSIDRKENDKGYTYENIRVLSLADNTRKGSKVLVYDWETKTARVV